MVAAAIIGGAVVGAAGSAYAGSQASGAAKNASNNSRDMFNTIVGQEQPFTQGGYMGLQDMEQLLGLGGDKKAANYGSLTKPFTAQNYLANQDPGYQFQLQTGAQALRNADTPGVGSLSGAALKDLMSFNQGMAATGYQNAFNRYITQQNNTFARLQDMASLGQNAASNTGNAGTALAGQQANAIMGAGNANAQGTLGATGALSGGANSIAGLMYLRNQPDYSNPMNLGGSIPTAPEGSNLTYDPWGNITGHTPGNGS